MADWVQEEAARQAKLSGYSALKQARLRPVLESCLRAGRAEGLREAADRQCEWCEDDDGVWHTGCGHAFWFDSDGPVENLQKFCGYCGGNLIARALADETPDSGQGD